MNTTARILMVGLGTLWACLPPSAAGSPWKLRQTWLSSAVLRQADLEDEQDQARDLISRARQAIKEGDLETAEKLVGQAEALDVTYNPLHLGDTPKKARRDLEKAKKRRSGKKETLADRFKFFGKDDAEEEAPSEDPFATAGVEEEVEPAASEPAPQNAPPQLSDPLSAPMGERASVQRRVAPSGDAEQAKQLLLSARRAMAYGDLNRAKTLADQAAALNQTYDLADDSPAKVKEIWNRIQDLQQRDPSTRTSESYRREYSGILLEQAEAFLQWNDLDEAERLCKVADQQKINYGPFDVKPENLLRRIAEVRTGKAPSTGLAAVTGEPPQLQPIGAGAPLPSAMSEASKQQMMELIRQSRAALAANDLDAAERLGRQAEAIHLPDNAFAQGEDRPWLLLLDIQKARMNRARTGVAPATYDAANDPTRNAAVQATSPFDESEPTLADEPNSLPETDPSGTSLPTPPGEGPGMALFQQGEQALKDRDVNRAVQLFREAAAHRDEFDPLTWQRLQDHLGLLSSAPPSNPAAPQGQDAAQRQQLAARQVSAELNRLEGESNRLLEADPRRAREVLVTAGQMVENSGIDPASRDILLRRVQRDLTQVDQYIANNQGRIELLDQNRQVQGEIDREAKMKVEVDQKLATLVNDFNRLMDERRYPEAELVAKQAQELAPDAPITLQLRTMVRQVRQIATEVQLTNYSEEGVLASLTNVRAAQVPFDDANPYQFGDVKEWEAMTKRRKSLDPRNGRRSEKDLEIEQKLKTPVSLSFQARPLAEVIDYLGKVSQVNVYLNPQGLADAGVTSDTPVTIDLKDEISLKSALLLILEPLNLTYVIKNEVLNITSEDQKDDTLYPVVYNVGDLIIGIPNFVPNAGMGLAGYIQDAHNRLGYGGVGGFGGQPPISVVASKSGARSSAQLNPEILAQMGASEGAMHSGATPVAVGSGGPGGIGGGVQPDFDSLIDLITSTIQPTTWTDVGGTGAIQEYENNLTLVISQTQDVHEEIADLLEQLRRLQDLQVTIEVRFITLSDQYFERIGVDFDFDLDDDSDRPFQVFGQPTDQIGTDGNPVRDFQDRDHGRATTVGLDPITGNFTSDLDVPFRQGSFSLAVPQFGGFDPSAGATLGFAILSDIEARFIMAAAQGDRRSNILQAPKVTLFNGQQAFVSDQSQSPFVISVIPVVGDFAAAQQPVIVVLNEGTHMSVQAVVSADRRFVRMTIVPFFSQIGDVDTFTFTGESSTTEESASEGPDDDTTSRSGTTTTTTAGTTVQLPTFSFTTVTTTVSVPDGGTVLLGGIKRMNEGRNEFGVPLLSKVPYVNRLFKNVGIGHETQSLMMMVTPRIIIQEEEEALLGVPQAGAPAQP